MATDKSIRQREYKRRWTAARKAAAMAGQVCAHCSSSENLQLDHIDPSLKKHRIDHNIWTWSRARREAELAKCQWLCKSCHLNKSITERGFSVAVHGSASMRKRGCRCDPCTAADREYRRAYYAKIRDEYNARRRSKYRGEVSSEPRKWVRRFSSDVTTPRIP